METLVAPKFDFSQVSRNQLVNQLFETFKEDSFEIKNQLLLCDADKKEWYEGFKQALDNWSEDLTDDKLSICYKFLIQNKTKGSDLSLDIFSTWPGKLWTGIHWPGKNKKYYDILPETRNLITTKRGLGL